MNPQDVLAVVVSYNGQLKTRQTVDALRLQVGHVHVVDNGSDRDSLVVLETLQQAANVTVEFLDENRGIGYALNTGVRRARQLGYDWLLTMDQDSTVDELFMESYQAAIRQEPRCVCLSPRIVSKTRKKDAKGGVVTYAITSGNLVRVSLFEEVGTYDEGFFVDCVDFDFSLRVRWAGHEVHRIPTALMQHQLGDSVELPSRVRGYYAQHSPVRRYYMYRNYLYLAQRYLFKFPWFVIKLGLGQMILLILIGFMDPGPVSSYRAVVRGVRDYFLGKQGPLKEEIT